jgi:[acyl-carrier-protein] S-malonyltransferase
MNQLAFIFPGQGSQSVGMLAALAERSASIRDTFDEASDALDLDLWALASRGPEEQLNRTAITQPVMLAADVAVWRAWQQEGGEAPSLLAGHSLGEYAALVAAESISLRDATALVARRGELMQSAVKVGQGAMAAILGLEDEVVEALCREVAEGQVVAAANYNSPGQIVIAGEAAAVERAMHEAKSAGARRAVILPVSVPSHCALMRPAAAALEESLASIAIAPPRIAVLHNVDVARRDQADAIREALSAQMYSPVRWTGTIRQMIAEGIERIAECGPGRVLSGLGRRISRDTEWLTLEDPETLRSAAHS